MILAIKYYFKGTNNIRIVKTNFFIWEVYKKEVLYDIINHCQNLNYSLLGSKLDDLKLFISHFIFK